MEKKIIEAKSGGDKDLIKSCDTLIKMIDNQVNKGVKNKLNQIKSMVEFGDNVKVKSGDIIELSHKLDEFIREVIKMSV